MSRLWLKFLNKIKSCVYSSSRKDSQQQKKKVIKIQNPTPSRQNNKQCLNYTETNHIKNKNFFPAILLHEIRDNQISNGESNKIHHPKEANLKSTSTSQIKFLNPVIKRINIFIINLDHDIIIKTKMFLYTISIIISRIHRNKYLIIINNPMANKLWLKQKKS